MESAAYRGPRRAAAALAASIAAHAALIAAIIYLIPPLVHRPTSIVLAYFIELGDSGAGGSIGTRPAGQPGNFARATVPPPTVRRTAHPHRRSADNEDDSVERKPDVQKLAGLPTPSIETHGAVPVYGGAEGVRHGAAESGGQSVSVATRTGPPSGAGGDGRGSAQGSGTSGAYARYGANPLPPYPAHARRHGQQGTVMLHVLVAADGTVERVELAQSCGFDSLDRSALETVRTLWRFVPARRDGAGVESWVLVPIRFTLAEASLR